MAQDLAPLLEYLDRRFGSIEQQLAEVKDGFSALQGAVDAYAKRADTYFQEMLMLAHKVERHDRWLHQIAERLDVKLEY